MLAMLCVDSDTDQLDKLTQDLAELNHRITILQATSQQQALALLANTSNEIAIIISAQILNDGNASTLFSHSDPDLIRKIIYGKIPNVEQLITCINQGDIDYVLTSPYEKSQLISTIKQQIHEYITQARLQQKLQASIPDNKVTQSPNSPVTSQDTLLDFSLYSDQKLSQLVINSLNKILEEKHLLGVKLHYSADHVLTREGERNYFLWFITKGKVLLKKRNAHGITQSMTTMEAGSIVGGMSFLTTETAFSTAITLTNTEVIKVDNHLFSKILQSNSDLLSPFTNLLLRNFNRRLQHSISTELALQESLKSLDIAYQQLLDSEKMVVLGELVSGVAHELNNPVAAILRGSETLISLMPHLFSDNLQSDNKSSPFLDLAQDTLHNGLSISALSTAEVRKRTRAIQDQVNDKNLAKKLVNMQLDQQQIPLENGRDLNESIQLLDKFHQAGTILRNSNACANRIASLVKSLKHYAGHDSKEVSMIDVHEGLEETLVIFESRLKNYNIVKNYQELPHIECHPIALEQVWTNIIANAIDAMGEFGALTLSTTHFTEQDFPYIEISIEDNGPGIPDSIKAKVFELNYTTKREGNFGLGIGLNISSQIIKRHRGNITIKDGSQGGAKFIITLPIKNSVTERKL
ncbi:cyclic nucleotide-binding domain-containing protein [Psychromonas sp. RZ22]|uniref:ATP-binding protein n=1 Tax=Psychromonas algarum TaxID=2555643 RepID=UPI001067D860|nr:ATP-binding protein [Psychromonas sp. RZ22]TEW55631.1 cyclic nucleotide-binding domain-containing protein [Psychromonas sp. RZ22]